MTGLEQSYYIIGIVFMSLMIILITVIVVAIVVIRNKVVSLERNVSEKLHTISKLPEIVVDIVDAFKDIKKSNKESSIGSQGKCHVYKSSSRHWMRFNSDIGVLPCSTL